MDFTYLEETKTKKNSFQQFLHKHKKALSYTALGLLGVAFLAGLYWLTQPDSQPFIRSITQNTVDGDKPSVPNPLDGVLYTKQEAAKWQDRPVLGIMVENLGSDQVRPQAGLGSAEVVYETLTEGGITRFMAMYLAKDVKVGPIRSARAAFLDWLSEYDGVYVHIGGSTEALRLIPQYGINNLEESYPTFTREILSGVSREHTTFSTTNKLWGKADEEGFAPGQFKSWSFQDETRKATEAISSASSLEQRQIDVEFTGDELYNVTWTYDPLNNVYRRENGGEEHLDKLTNSQLAPKNVVIQFVPMDTAYLVKEGQFGVKVSNIGSGNALVFQNGDAIQAVWTKRSRSDRTIFKDSQGQEIKFNRGQVWIQVVPPKAEVKY